jgi:hypothetical protein
VSPSALLVAFSLRLASSLLVLFGRLLFLCFLGFGLISLVWVTFVLLRRPVASPWFWGVVLQVFLGK